MPVIRQSAAPGRVATRSFPCRKSRNFPRHSIPPDAIDHAEKGSGRRNVAGNLGHRGPHGTPPAFASFVAAHAHILASFPEQTAFLAQNIPCAGPVAASAATRCDSCKHHGSVVILAPGRRAIVRPASAPCEAIALPSRRWRFRRTQVRPSPRASTAPFESGTSIGGRVEGSERTCGRGSRRGLHSRRETGPVRRRGQDRTSLGRESG